MSSITTESENNSSDQTPKKVENKNISNEASDQPEVKDNISDAENELSQVKSNPIKNDEKKNTDENVVKSDSQNKQPLDPNNDTEKIQENLISVNSTDDSFSENETDKIFV